MLEVFATADDVFSEHDAFDRDKVYAGLGRLYRSWQAAREMIDPEFDRHRYHHEQGEV